MTFTDGSILGMRPYTVRLTELHILVRGIKNLIKTKQRIMVRTMNSETIFSAKKALTSTIIKMK